MLVPLTLLLGPLEDTLADARGTLRPAHRARLVAGRVTLAREELARHGCALVLELEPGLVGDFDVPRLSQLVRGLLSNATRFGPGQPVRCGCGGTRRARCSRWWTTAKA